MFNKYLLLSQINISPNQCSHVTKIWHRIFDIENNQYHLYENYESNNSILMITTLDDAKDVFEKISHSKMIQFENEIREDMQSDWRHQVLSLEESIIPFNPILSISPFLQLRHIEVPLRVYSQYLNWRKETIFNHVKQQADIDFFLSYHSVLSTEPGVMFLSGFSCDPAVYLNLFNNEKYKEIVREAGDKYISGGEKGLYTHLYRLSKHTSIRE